MRDFVFENPTKIIFGRNKIGQIGGEIRRFGKKALFVYGQNSIKKNGIYAKVTVSLRKAGVEFVEFPGVRANPVLSHVLEGIELARRENIDVILAVGGGSVIDASKTIAAGVKADHDVWDFFTYKKTIERALPILTIVTVAASASEMNSAAVITKEETAQKFSIRSPFVQPKASILDPSTLFTLSPAYSAYSAVDAITHMLEGYFNNKEPNGRLQDRLVEGLIKTVIESTEAILKNPADYDARADMMWSATLAFNGLTTAGMGAVSFPVHMIEHSLSAIYDIAHGAGLSIVLPGWMRYAAQKDFSKFACLAGEIFGVCGGDEQAAGIEGINLLKTWFSDIGSPVSLGEANISHEDIGEIAQNARALAEVWGLEEYTEKVIEDILNLCK